MGIGNAVDPSEAAAGGMLIDYGISRKDGEVEGEEAVATLLIGQQYLRCAGALRIGNPINPSEAAAGGMHFLDLLGRIDLKLFTMDTIASILGSEGLGVMARSMAPLSVDQNAVSVTNPLTSIGLYTNTWKRTTIV